MHRTLLAGLAGITLALAGTAAADAATVTVRVEGKDATLLPATPVVQTSAPEPDTGCDGDSTVAALDIATKNDWDNGSFVQTILGETHNDPAAQDSWQLWIFRGGRYVSSAQAACDEKLAAGEESLWAYNVYGLPNGEPQIFPTWTTGLPATVAPGAPVGVTVKRSLCDGTDPYCNAPTAAPLAGATVSGGDAGATTAADGTAQVSFATRGAHTIVTSKAGFVRSQASTCVTDGADGYCGTTAPDGTTLPAEQGGTVPVQTAPVPGPDTGRPVGAIGGVKEQQVFKRRKNAPRRLRATLTDPSGIASVTIGLTRQVGKRCWAFSGTKERFVASRCGKHPRFKTAVTNGAVDYLLPGRLGKGRYAFDVITTDAAGNTDTLARGRSRVVFTVR